MYREDVSRLLRRSALNLALTACLAACPAASNDQPWQPGANESGVLVEVRDVPGSKYQEFRARTTIDLPMARVLAVLADIPACPQWMHQCERARTLEDRSERERIIHQVTNLPFPVKSRDLVLRVTLEADARAVLVRLEALPGHIPTRSDAVRIRKSHGHYRLEEAGTGTLVEWQQFADPAGRVPAFIVRGMMTELPVRSLSRLRSWAREPRYDGFRLIRDAQGRIERLERPAAQSIPASDV
ncbi:MAG: hypothetical protein CMQ24_10040 [Gammaproteobacteria bacterium]|nr:hypothetical protein [Gammaproteobacteria bacterium]